MDRPTALWLGSTAGSELGLARRWLGERFEIVAEGDAGGFTAPPLLACLAIDSPGRHSIESAIRVTRAWPLCRVIAITTSLMEGRRRSGPSLPGVEDVPWHDLAGRIELWLADLRAGRPGPLGMPPTSRREDRVLDAIASILAGTPPARGVAAAASHRDALEGLAALLEAIGCPPTDAMLGRPAMQVQADVLVWDCGGTVEPEMPWLQVLAAQHPDTDIVLLESFPRGERALRAMRAGAACVLGRPTSAEVLSGTLRWLGSRRKQAMPA